MSKLSSAAIALIVSLSLAACGGGGGGGASSNAPRQQLQITAKDFALKVDGAASVRPGQVDISALNQGKEQHGLLLGRLNDGVEAASVVQLIAKDPKKALTMFSLAGGIAALAPGGAAWKATTTVRSGTYILVDTGTGRDGKANFTKPSEIQTFNVSGATHAAASVKSDAGVTLRDYAIDMPAAISATAALRVRNSGHDDHELTFVKVANQKVGTAFINLIRAGKPVQFKSQTVAALAPTGPGTDTTIHVKLPPGQYLAYCSFTSAGSKNKPHAALGMVRQVEVKK